MKQSLCIVKWIVCAAVVGLGCGLTNVWAQDEVAAISTGDTAWMLASSAFVMAMILPGLAFFYGGSVRSKNALGTIMHTAILLCLISIVWVVVGYSLAFGTDIGGFVGGLDYLLLKGVGEEANGTIPHVLFVTFQMLFAAITVALITGSFAERVKFSSLLVFGVLWSICIYSPLAHWVWGGGWLGEHGALDFAGGAVVHLSSGVSALVCVLVIGKRKGFGVETMAPHNLPFTVIGTGLLWFGWFGFNAGSALAANGQAASAFLATHLAASAGGLGWMIAEWIKSGKPTVLGVASGAVAGLVGVTSGAGFLGPVSALIVGFAAGIVCYAAVLLKSKFGYDDALDVVGIHGVGGFFGMVAVGLLASMGGAHGYFDGNPGQLWLQIEASLATVAFVLVGTYVLLKIVDWTLGLRIALEEEERGLDLSQHNERAYS